jgi:hypothetical protein
MMKSILFLNACLVALSSAGAQPLLRAFPEAERFGAATPGGRGGRVHLVTSTEDYINYVCNYLKAGPSTRKSAATDIFDPGDNMARIYLADNYLEGDPEHTEDNVLLLDPPKGVDEVDFLNDSS